MPQTLGLGLGGSRRRRLIRDNVLAITKPSIRRLARRGGVKRMSAEIYPHMRQVLKDRLREIIQKLVLVLESSSTPSHERKTVTTIDVVYVLNRMGNPVYGFHAV